MKTLILLLSMMMITSIATAKRSEKDSGRRDFDSEQHENGDGDQEHKRRDFDSEKHENGDGDKEHKRGRKHNKEKLQQRLKRMTKGDEAEYNRLMKLHKEDPEAFRAEMKAKRTKRNKNKKSKAKSE